MIRQSRRNLKNVRKTLGKYRKKGFSIFCLDETLITIRPFLARGWALHGSKPVAIIRHTRDYFYVMIARSRRKLYAAVYNTVNQKKLVRFLKGLLRHYSRLVVLLDSEPGHKGPLLQEFLERNSKCLKLVFSDAQP